MDFIINITELLDNQLISNQFTVTAFYRFILIEFV